MSIGRGINEKVQGGHVNGNQQGQSPQDEVPRYLVRVQVQSQYKAANVGCYHKAKLDQHNQHLAVVEQQPEYVESDLCHSSP